MKHRLAYNLLLVTLMLYFAVPAFAVDGRLDNSSIVSERDLPRISKEEGAAPQREISLENVPLAAQDLGLMLVGTVVADNPRMSAAIIDNRSTGKQELRREGDVVGQALIKKILRNKVIIDAGRGNELLTTQSAGSARISSTPRQPLRNEEPKAEVSTSGLDRESVDSAVPDYKQFMQEIRVRPHLEGGQPAGFLIYNIDPDGIFAKMGLENGDVITAVNGKPITITRQAVDFYNALKESGEVVLKVKRGDDTQEIRFEIQ